MPDFQYTVTELNNKIKYTIEASFRNINIIGEISNLHHHSYSGHTYFTLKDQNSELKAVMFRNRNKLINFNLKNGIQVSVKADLAFYEKRGQTQLIVFKIEPIGEGDLHRAFNDLKKFFSDNGMFDSIHKKPIPKYPKLIGVVTSLTGAALRDFLDVMKRRAPHLEIIIYPTLVQGEGAAKSIANAINKMNKLDLVDLIVITRGGGSIEDLWAFNEKIVAEMIFKSSIPIVSAIGHETDFTISDFISDLRAATPSVAAELISVSKERLIENLGVVKSRLNKKIENILNTFSLDFDYFEKILISNKPEAKIKLQQEKVHKVKILIINLIKQKIDEIRIELKIAENQLQSYNPENILKRGYSIALDNEGLPVKDSKKIKTDDIFSLILNKGKIRAKKISN